MKLLFVTQVMDENDAILGAYHGWVKELAARVESIEVVCLREGKHTLPTNVHVHSLGKERGRRSRLSYALRFISLSWKLRNDYHVVLVHMNQEYVLIAGWLWKLMGMRVYLWRNHYQGSWLTDVAAAFCTKVFCTSRASYTAKYPKAVLLPVGVDLAQFTSHASVSRAPGSVLFLARMAPSKRPELLIDALALLREKGRTLSATFVGSPAAGDRHYYEQLQQRVASLALPVRFLPSAPNKEAAEIFRAHDIFVNCSPSGMFDKTLFEAAACGCIVLAASEDFAWEAGQEFSFTNAEGLAAKLELFVQLPLAMRETAGQKLLTAARRNSLEHLAGELIEALQ